MVKEREPNFKEEEEEFRISQTYEKGKPVKLTKPKETKERIKRHREELRKVMRGELTQKDIFRDRRIEKREK